MWFSGVLLLLLRLLQTSGMALVQSQDVQAAIVCSITLISILLHSTFSPMRRVSDNHVALLAQVLVFLWPWTLLLRITGMFQRPSAAVAVGTLLCIATVGVFVAAFVLANIDRRKENRAIRERLTASGTSDGTSTERSEIEIELVDMTQEAGFETAQMQSRDAAGKLDEGAPARRGSASPREEEKNEESPSSWSSSLLVLGNSALCGAEPTAEDGTTKPPVE